MKFKKKNQENDFKDWDNTEHFQIGEVDRTFQKKTKDISDHLNNIPYSGFTGDANIEDKNTFYVLDNLKIEESDHIIANKIFESLAELKRFHSLDIEFQVDRGVVTLSGKVSNAILLDKFTNLIRHFSGVIKIKNQVIVLGEDSVSRGPEIMKEKDLGLN